MPKWRLFVAVRQHRRTSQPQKARQTTPQNLVQKTAPRKMENSKICRHEYPNRITTQASNIRYIAHHGATYHTWLMLNVLTIIGNQTHFLLSCDPLRFEPSLPVAAHQCPTTRVSPFCLENLSTFHAHQLCRLCSDGHRLEFNYLCTFWAHKDP